MENKNIQETKKWFDNSYEKSGFGAQRLYPNEELLRFIGKNYFSYSKNERRKIKVLEVGCGSCSNLWMIAKEGFDAYGIDLSKESLDLGKLMLDHWGVEATLIECSMTDMPFQEREFDFICDVFSSYCLNIQEYMIFLDGVARTIKDNGKFFSYIPSINSDAFKNYLPADKIDNCTLNGIYRVNSPFYGNFYNFRFTDINILLPALEERGFKVTSLEFIQKSYNSRAENFEFISIEAIKNPS